MARVDTRSLGRDAERIAEQFLIEHGLAPIARNFRCRLGEIDLIARHAAQLVFVEVRFRGPGSLFRAQLTVDRHKQNKLIRTAALFVARRPQFANSVMRFDVVAIDDDGAGKTSIDWIRDAFRPQDSGF